MKQAWQQWSRLTLASTSRTKLQNASQMVEKMSKFSRHFISLNSLSQVVRRNDLTRKARTFMRWQRSGKSDDLKEQLFEARQALLTKDSKLKETEAMFKEYQSWRGKLEQIETRMRSEVDHWKSAA